MSKIMTKIYERKISNFLRKEKKTFNFIKYRKYNKKLIE